MNPSEIPVRLRGHDQWVNWQYIERDGKPGKRPVDPRTAGPAKIDNPATWGTFEQAVSLFQSQDGIDGIGFVLTEDDSVIGFDVDHCIDDEGEYDARAKEVLERTTSYAEYSPSKHGIRLFAIGELVTARNRRGGVEAYEADRYLTVTGDHVDGTPASVESDQEFIDWFVDAFLTAESEEEADATTPRGQRPPRTGLGIASRLSDQNLLEKARQAKNGEKFIDLFQKGNLTGHESRSEADLALCSILAFWSGGNPRQMDRLFRQSALMRDKWDRTHASNGRTYGELTINEAIDRTSEYYDPTYHA